MTLWIDFKYDEYKDTLYWIDKCNECKRINNGCCIYSYQSLTIFDTDTTHCLFWRPKHEIVY